MGGADSERERERGPADMIDRRKKTRKRCFFLCVPFDEAT